MTKPPKAPLSPEQTAYNEANTAYQDSWRKAAKTKTRYRQAETAYLAQSYPIEDDYPTDPTVAFHAAKDALAQEEQQVIALLAMREDAYKALVRSQEAGR